MTGLCLRLRSKSFAGLPVLGGITLDLAPGEIAALLGPSGAGKTTLLNVIAGLDEAFDGEIHRPDGPVAMVFQTPRLLPWRTLSENITLVPGAGGRDRAEALLAQVGLGEAANAYPERVSLGMQRRAALARALALSPDLVVMDEPTVSLDPAMAASMRGLIRDVLTASGATAVIATHDRAEALGLADRVLELSGRPASLTRDRKNPLDRAARKDETARNTLLPGWFASQAQAAE
ncbi:MAG: ATP-binding cassette domain-containing protein [Pseudomonadota bacterium]